MTTIIEINHELFCYRIQPLVLCIKEWAHQNDINDAKTGTLSSYALVLMVIHYLQVCMLSLAEKEFFRPCN